MGLPKTCNVRELAEYTGYTPGYVRDLCRFGIIPRDYIIRRHPRSPYRFLVKETLEFFKADLTPHQARCKRILDERKENRGANY